MHFKTVNKYNFFKVLVPLFAIFKSLLRVFLFLLSILKFWVLRHMSVFEEDRLFYSVRIDFLLKEKAYFLVYLCETFIEVSTWEWQIMQVFSFLKAVLILKSSFLVRFHKYIAVIPMFLSHKIYKTHWFCNFVYPSERWFISWCLTKKSIIHYDVLPLIYILCLCIVLDF